MKAWREDDGYVTVAVVGITALMAVLVVGVLTMSRPTSLLARLDLEQLHRQTRIEAGLNAAAFLLFFSGEAPSALRQRQWTIDRATVGIEVSAEKGRIDLNRSSPDLLRRLFSAAGGTSMSPDAFAARVQDWRDEDNEKTIEGAEAFEYRATPQRVQPANAPFRSVGELRFLLGLSREDLAKIDPYLTTYNRDGIVDPESAAALVRTVIKGGGPSIGMQTVSPSSEEAEPRATEATSPRETPEAFRVRVLTRAQGGGSVRGAEAIIVPPVDERENYSILEWRDVPQDAYADAPWENSP